MASMTEAENERDIGGGLDDNGDSVDCSKTILEGLVGRAKSSPSFLEVVCRNSGVARRFAAGTDAGFAVYLLNRRRAAGDPLVSHIEAFKEGEESVSFGRTAPLVDYGIGWKLQTVLEEGFEGPRRSQRKLERDSPGMKTQDRSAKNRKKAQEWNTSVKSADNKPDTWAYTGKIFLVFVFMFLLGTVFTVFLEFLPELITFVSTLF